MADIYEIEDIDGVRFNWNTFPVTRLESENMASPVGCLYTPLLPREDLPIANYDPQLCRKCRSALNVFSQIDMNNRTWTCPICFNRNQLPPQYQNISADNVPIELMPQASTMEYILNRSQPPPPPAFIYVIDLCQDPEDLKSLKDTLIASLDLHPPGCFFGLVTFDSVVNVHELSFTSCSKKYVFSGKRELKSYDVQEQLGIKGNASRPWSQQFQSGSINNTINKFLLPLADETAKAQIVKSIEASFGSFQVDH